MLYSISLLMQPTRIGRSIRNLRGYLCSSATRLCFYLYLVARFLPRYYLSILPTVGVAVPVGTSAFTCALLALICFYLAFLTILQLYLLMLISKLHTW